MTIVALQHVAFGGRGGVAADLGAAGVPSHRRARENRINRETRENGWQPGMCNVMKMGKAATGVALAVGGALPPNIGIPQRGWCCHGPGQRIRCSRLASSSEGSVDGAPGPRHLLPVPRGCVACRPKKITKATVSCKTRTGVHRLRADQKWHGHRCSRSFKALPFTFQCVLCDTVAVCLEQALTTLRAAVPAPNAAPHTPAL